MEELYRQVITSSQVDFSYLTTLHSKYLRQVLASARYGQNVKEEVFGMVCGSQSSWLGFDNHNKLFLPFELKNKGTETSKRFIKVRMISKTAAIPINPIVSAPDWPWSEQRSWWRCGDDNIHNNHFTTPLSLAAASQQWRFSFSSSLVPFCFTLAQEKKWQK